MSDGAFAPGWNDAYPHAVDSGKIGPMSDSWNTVCKWCDKHLHEDWEYFNGEFRFKTEQAKMWFLMRWS